MNKYTLILRSVTMFILLLSTLSVSAQQNTFGYKGYVVKKDGEREYGTLKLIESPLGFGTTVLLNDSTTFTFHDFDSLRYRDHPFVLHQEVHQEKGGTTFKYQLLKMVSSGPLMLYARITDESKILSRTAYDYFSTTGSQISKVSTSNLSDILKQKPQSGHRFQKSRRFARISNSLFIVGGASLLYGVFESGVEEGLQQENPFAYRSTIAPNFHESVYVGLGCLVTATIFRGFSKKYFRQSIDLFNLD